MHRLIGAVSLDASQAHAFPHVGPRGVVSTMTLLVSLAVASPASASPITIDARARGLYDSSGVSNGTAADNDYGVGDLLGTEYRNWFLFDLWSLSGTVSSATLLLEIPAAGYVSTSGASETYSLFDISGGTVLGADSVGIWEDLGSGTSLGSYVATGADKGTTIAIPLNAAGLALVQAQLGFSLAFGGAITTVNGIDDLEFLFGESVGGRTQLQVEIATVPEPATLLLLGTGLNAVAVVARRRKKRRA